SGTEQAVTCDGGTLTLANTKLQGAEAGISSKGGLTLKATKGTRIVATTGYGILASSNAELTINDAAVEAATKAFKGGVNAKLKLGTGARLSGKRGAIDGDSNLELEATGATIDGGSGAGIAGTYNAKVALHGGSVKGNPSVQFQRP